MNAPVENGGGPRAAALVGARQILALLVVAMIAVLAFMAVHHNDDIADASGTPVTIEIAHVTTPTAVESLDSSTQPDFILLTGCAILVLCGALALVFLLAARTALRTQPGLHEFIAWLKPSFFLSVAAPRPSLTTLSISRT